MIFNEVWGNDTTERDSKIGIFIHILLTIKLFIIKAHIM